MEKDITITCTLHGWHNSEVDAPDKSSLYLCYCKMFIGVGKSENIYKLCTYNIVRKKWNVTNYVEVKYWMELPEVPK